MIVDANPIVTACLGRSQPLFVDLIASGADLFVPEHQMREARLVLERESRRRGHDPGPLLAWTTATLLVIPSELYIAYEAEARERLQPSGQKDWPLIALALASGDEVWSNDLDLFGTGIVVWNTHNVRRSRR